MRVAGMEDEWLFDQIPRPKEEMRRNKKKQDIQLRDSDTVIVVTLARLKNLEELDLGHGVWTKSFDLPVLFEKKYLKKLKKVRLDTEPILPLMEGPLHVKATRGPSNWDTYSPYNPKSIDRRTLQHLLSLPHMESIACVAADRKYSTMDDSNEGDMNEENMDERNSDHVVLNEQVLNNEALNQEDMDEDSIEEDVELNPIEQPYKNLTSLSLEKSRLSHSTLGKILEARIPSVTHDLI